jgi:HEPN domain-containing protein
MSDKEQAEGARWLVQAEADVETVRVLTDGGRYYMACFVSQQAAEKALKAYLYFKGAALVFGHSIARLCNECAIHDAAFSQLRARVKNLDHFYIEARYPNGLPDVTPAEFFDRKDANEASEAAAETVNFVRARMSNPKG